MFGDILLEDCSFDMLGLGLAFVHCGDVNIINPVFTNCTRGMRVLYPSLVNVSNPYYQYTLGQAAFLECIRSAGQYSPGPDGATINIFGTVSQRGYVAADQTFAGLIDIRRACTVNLSYFCLHDLATTSTVAMKGVATDLDTPTVTLSINHVSFKNVRRGIHILSPQTTYSGNNNCFEVMATAVGRIGTTDYVTLANWQSALAALLNPQDVNSVGSNTPGTCSC